MTAKSTISRRHFLAAGMAMAATPAQAFDFLNGGSSDFDFIGGGQTPRGYNSRQQSGGSSCGTKSAAMSQRTGSSRPITQVRYGGAAAVGSIEVSISKATLYHVSAPGVATAYPIGAGDDSRSLIGKNIVVGRQAAWPTWTPTKNIARRMGISQETRAGGPCNPLGAFALYLYENGQDTVFRIHGTNEPSSVGNPNASSGCIRMYNEDVVHLQRSVSNGTRVGVYMGDVPGIGNAPARRVTP